MKDRKLFFLYIFSSISILLNILMMFIVRTGNQDRISNIIVIAVTLFALRINKIATVTNQTQQVRPEFYGILFMFGISVIRFINRITVLPDAVNWVSVIITVGAGTVILFIAIGRIIENKNRFH